MIKHPQQRHQCRLTTSSLSLRAGAGGAGRRKKNKRRVKKAGAPPFHFPTEFATQTGPSRANVKDQFGTSARSERRS
ncbi:hypothetical protein EVAR_49646_1 [Eumeta japonica]|uniref:Uncharacterized protein n=1 Tax=Eumeta variegata TaxID=151549 RepID=A0A4C1Y753_EUMVA|nr:hypothetical protein EVAR_49646_1 [Eumeta japonica]